MSLELIYHFEIKNYNRKKWGFLKKYTVFLIGCKSFTILLL